MPRVPIGTPNWGDDLNQDLDAIEALADAAFQKVKTVPTGTGGWETQVDGTLWVEYTP